MSETTHTGRGRGSSPATAQLRRQALARELAGVIGQGLRREGWEQRGACSDRQDDVMFPDASPGTAAHARESGPARALCAACPVRERCLEHALNVGEPDGIWGGLDEAERRELRRQRRAPARELEEAA